MTWSELHKWLLAAGVRGDTEIEFWRQYEDATVQRLKPTGQGELETTMDGEPDTFVIHLEQA